MVGASWYGNVFVVPLAIMMHTELCQIFCASQKFLYAAVLWNTHCRWKWAYVGLVSTYSTFTSRDTHSERAYLSITRILCCLAFRMCS